MFFFSRRTRHKISLCDWSSDVCSSDLREGRNRGSGRCFRRPSQPDRSRGLPRRQGTESSASALRLFPYQDRARSEEHTSELQSHSDLVCRLLLENKKYCSTSCSATTEA